MAHKLSVEDRLDIRDFFNRYCYLVDDNEQEAWLDLFTHDGVFDVPGLARMQGRDELRRIIEMVAQGSGGHWRHQLTNILAEAGDEPDTARVRAYGLVTDWRDGGEASTFNDYRCRLIKIDGQWYLSELMARAARLTVNSGSEPN